MEYAESVKNEFEKYLVSLAHSGIDVTEIIDDCNELLKTVKSIF